MRASRSGPEPRARRRARHRARHWPASAPQAGEVDLDAPMAPMPDLDIAWPDPAAALPEAPVAGADAIAGAPAASPVPPAAPAAPRMLDDGTLVRRANLVLSGLEVEEGDAIIAAFDAASALRKDGGQANAAQIDRRARDDSELLAELLKAQGYYDARVTVAIDAGASAEALVVRLEAEPGPRYHFTSVALPGLEAAGAAAGKLRETFAVHEGDAVVAADVLAAGQALKTRLAETGYAAARIGERDILINHDTASAALTLPVEPGPVARFGAIRVSGAPPFPARHVAGIARFRTGDLFQQSEVDDLRRALIATGLVASADTKLVPAGAAGDVVDVEVALQPAPMRTVAGALGYGTGEGVRAEASWEHRNFFNPEGALTVRGVLGTQEQLASVSLRKSNWQRRDRTLNFLASAAHVDRQAYEAKTSTIQAGVERLSNFIWQKPWTWSVGAELIASDERDTIVATGVERRRTFFIGALPASLYYDGSDDLLNPQRGSRLGGRISPEASLQGGASAYVKAQIDGSAYWPVSDRVVAAGRVRFGWIAGAERDGIAPSRRFYAGGGGSVRGYGYQRLGPKDADDNPIGGRSLAEFAIEARVRFGNFGVVPFLDGGVLSPEAQPDLGDLQLGAGIGVRYYSSFGPIRVDVGTPLNREPGDSRIAVTVSLGQAF